MIDFSKGGVIRLEPVPLNQMREQINQFLIEGEVVIAVFKSVRDQLVFTNKRIVAANVQGLTGKKVDYTSIPFSKVQTFSVETAGTLDLDCELEIYISSIGKIHFEIAGQFDVVTLNKAISRYVLEK